jgi:dephospho-CoA kinase
MNPRIVGLTGSIGSGKSAVLSILAELGIPCSDADELARRAVEPGSIGLREVVAEFGEGVLTPDGSLDRKRLGEVVFADPQKRKTLERIIHPRVREAMLAFVSQQTGEAGLVVLDVPLLFENGFDQLCDRTATVVVDEQTRKSRLSQRSDRLSPEEVDRRLKAQMPQDEKVAKSDAVIDNNGTLEDTRRQVEALVRRWRDEFARA